MRALPLRIAAPCRIVTKRIMRASDSVGQFRHLTHECSAFASVQGTRLASWAEFPWWIRFLGYCQVVEDISAPRTAVAYPARAPQDAPLCWEAQGKETCKRSFDVRCSRLRCPLGASTPHDFPGEGIQWIGCISRSVVARPPAVRPADSAPASALIGRGSALILRAALERGALEFATSRRRRWCVLSGCWWRRRASTGTTAGRRWWRASCATRGWRSSTPACTALRTRIVEKLRASGAGDVAVVIGGVIPDDDIEPLRSQGVADIFPQDTPPDVIVTRIRALAAARPLE